MDAERYVGAYRAHDVVYKITSQDGQLVLTTNAPGDRDGSQPPISISLLPLGGDRFFPPDPIASGGRMWDVAFWGSDDAGRATHFLNGVFGAKRVD